VEHPLRAGKQIGVTVEEDPREAVAFKGVADWTESVRTLGDAERFEATDTMLTDWAEFDGAPVDNGTQRGDVSGA
jgi:hypothetical protein